MQESGVPTLGGSRPDGDPRAMRGWAASLRAIAEMVRRAGDGAADSVDAATFRGPAGNETRLRAGKLRNRSAAVAADLWALAASVASQAGSIEIEQDAWDRREQRNRKLAD